MAQHESAAGAEFFLSSLQTKNSIMQAAQSQLRLKQIHQGTSGHNFPKWYHGKGDGARNHGSDRQTAGMMAAERRKEQGRQQLIARNDGEV